METPIVRLCERINQKVKNEDNEFWVAMIGETGTGKSLFAQHFAYTLTRKPIPIANVLFDKHETINRIISCEKNSVLICDEAISAFFNRSSMSKEGRLIGELVNQIRQKNLVMILCVPRLLTIDPIILDKIKMVVEVKESRERQGDNFKLMKGNAFFYLQQYNNPQVTFFINYLKAKKNNPLAPAKKPNPSILHKGNFIGGNCRKPWYPILEGEAAYKKKKEEVLEKYTQKPEEDKVGAKSKAKRELSTVIANYYNNTKTPMSKMSELFGIPKSTIQDWIAGQGGFETNTDSNIEDNGAGLPKQEKPLVNKRFVGSLLTNTHD